MAKVALILSGCGVFDGSEIHESVLCLLALDEAHADVQCFAPKMEQSVVKNHLTGEEVKESRNVLVESARIARGKILPLSELDPDAFDAVLLPGGFGVALNLSTYGIDGEACQVNEDLKRVILEFHRAKKPIGATCITPAVLAKIFEGAAKVKLTLGTDASYGKSLEKMGMQAEITPQDGITVDEVNKVYTTPCYMEKGNLTRMLKGIKKVVEKLV